METKVNNAISEEAEANFKKLQDEHYESYLEDCKKVETKYYEERLSARLYLFGRARGQLDIWSKLREDYKLLQSYDSSKEFQSICTDVLNFEQSIDQVYLRDWSMLHPDVKDYANTLLKYIIERIRYNPYASGGLSSGLESVQTHKNSLFTLKPTTMDFNRISLASSGIETPTSTTLPDNLQVVQMPKDNYCFYHALGHSQELSGTELW